MRNLLIYIGLSLWMFGCEYPQESAPPPHSVVKPLKINISVTAHKTPRGICFWLVKDPRTPVIGVRFLFHKGFASDPKHQVGLGVFFADMVLKGAGTWSEEVFHDYCEDLGAAVNMQVREDQTVLSLQMLRRNYQEMIPLVHSLLHQPQFTSSAIQETKGKWIALLAHKKPKAGYVLQQKINQVLLFPHPYGQSPLDSEAQIQRIQKKDLEVWKQQLLSSAVDVVVVGNIELKEAEVLIDSCLGEGKFHEKQGLPDLLLQKISDSVIAIPAEVGQIEFRAIQPGLSMKDPDALVLSLISYILDRRIFDEVREKRGLAYSVRVTTKPYQKGGLILCAGGTKKESIQEVVSIIRQEWERLCNDGAKPEELQSAIEFMTNVYASYFISTDSTLDILSAHLSAGRGPDYVQKRTEVLKDLNVSRLNEAIRKYLRPKELTFFVHGIKDWKPRV